MYFNVLECKEGWVKNERACYKFFNHPKKQFAAAAKECVSLNSHLVYIESQREDKFLSKYLHENYPYVYVWRIGARKINDTMKW